jgi:prophage antirepressor-like protein
MTAIIPFEFEGSEVRIIDRDGRPWFVNADVCRAVEIRSPHKAFDRLDDDEKGRATIPTLGGPQEVAIINEPGCYRLIFTSRKPSAERFKRWLAHEVLPALRKTGRYEMPGASDRQSAGLEERRQWLREVELTFRLRGRVAAIALWDQSPLPRPDSSAASSDGEAPADEIDSFLAATVVFERNVSVVAGELYARYRAWTAGRGIEPVSLVRFGHAMSARGIRKRKSGPWRYLGLRLRRPGEPPSPFIRRDDDADDTLH